MSPLVVVTGAGRRGQVAEAVAQTFHATGWKVALVGRSLDDVRARAAELSPHTSAHACDLEVQADVDRVAAEVGRVHEQPAAALICVAGGFAAEGGVGATPGEMWERMFRINTLTASTTCRAFLPQLRVSRGAAVLFASASALPTASGKGMSAYVSAKAGVLSLCRVLAAEERHQGVRINALAPTAIRTESNLTAMGTDVSYVDRDVVGAWCHWLCAPGAGPVSGQVIQLG